MAVSLTPYQSAVAALFARTAGAVKPGLERIEALLATLHNPHLRYSCFHVAGTNGKGSVCATMDFLLRYKGKRVGRYSSPHLIDFRERIIINGVPISEEEVVGFLQHIDAQAQQIGATFFEITTAMAFWYFAKHGVDVAVIETGMGGLLDATNVVTPVVATVTNISLDHTEFLGKTLQEIAVEKAGIFKEGCPAVIGEARPEIGRMLATFAQERGAKPISTVRTDWRSWSITHSLQGTTFSAGTPAGEVRLTTPLHGEHQVRNTLTAIASLWLSNGTYRVPMNEVNKALAKLQLPGRFQRVGEWVFDVAHNAAGARALAEAIRVAKLPRPVTAMVAVLADKEWQAVLEALAPMVDRIIITQAPTAPADRTWDPMAAAMYVNKLRVPVDLEVNFDFALQRAADAKGSKIVTGSFHTVGDAMQRLGINPLDPSPVARGAPTR